MITRPALSQVPIRQASARKPRARLVRDGAIAQLGERLLCKQEVAGSIPAGSTDELPLNTGDLGSRGGSGDRHSGPLEAFWKPSLRRAAPRRVGVAPIPRPARSARSSPTHPHVEGTFCVSEFRSPGGPSTLRRETDPDGPSPAGEYPPRSGRLNTGPFHDLLKTVDLAKPAGRAPRPRSRKGARRSPAPNGKRGHSASHGEGFLTAVRRTRDDLGAIRGSGRAVPSPISP